MLGYELAEEEAVTSADVILVSTASGDLLFGIAKGLIEAKQAGVFARLPRLVAVEPFVRLTRVLAAGIIAEVRRKLTFELDQWRDGDFPIALVVAAELGRGGGGRPRSGQATSCFSPRMGSISRIPRPRR